MISKFQRPLGPWTSALVLVTLSSALVLAQPRAALAQARPEAEQLFRDGKQLLKDGKIAEACLAFEASEKAEASIATLLSLADCHEKAQQYASAWARFLAAESQTRGQPGKNAIANNRTARLRAAALEERLSFLTINVPDESRVQGLEVTLDGVAVAPGQWNRAVPVDGGAHVVSGKAPGHEPWSTTMQVSAERDRRAVEVPRFKELPDLAPPMLHKAALRGGAAGGDDDGELSLRERGPAPSPFTPRRKVALGLAIGSVVLAGTGVGLGVAASGARDEALELCPRANCTAAGAEQAQAKNDRARSLALGANLGYAAAGGAAIAAAILWFTSGPERVEQRGRSERAASAVRKPDSSSSSSVTSSISISPLLGEAAGLSLTGGF